jgi:hypothetical protein
MSLVIDLMPSPLASTESDPLPSFEKRQILAQQLGMTPRSVQIWFQNRRQRLLKPLRHAEGGELSPQIDLNYGSESSGDTISDSGSSSDLHRHSHADVAPASGRQPMQPMATLAVSQHHHSYPTIAAQLANLLGPLLHAEGVGRPSNMPAALAHLSTALAAGVVAEGAALGSAPSSRASWTALGDNVGAGAAVLLAHALQQQIAAGMVAQGQLGNVAPTAAYSASRAMVRREIAPSASSEGVDGLLLLSACADAQPPAPSSLSTSSAPKGAAGVQAVQILPSAMITA